MKSAIHPQYSDQVQVVCACSATFVTGSTKNSIKVEICSNCHPFYTGQQKFIDTVGKVQKFQTRQAVAATKQAVVKKKKDDKDDESRHPKTLREMLQGTK